MLKKLIERCKNFIKEDGYVLITDFSYANWTIEDEIG